MNSKKIVKEKYLNYIIHKNGKQIYLNNMKNSDYELVKNLDWLFIEINLCEKCGEEITDSNDIICNECKELNENYILKQYDQSGNTQDLDIEE